MSKKIYRDIEKLVSESTTCIRKQLEENKSKKGEVRWKTLRHNGVYFPPEYEPLPAHVQIKYEGAPVKLSTIPDKKFNVSAEEGAVFFAIRLIQDERLAETQPNRVHSKDDKDFVKNFWKDWKIILGSKSKITDFSKVDFTLIKKFLINRTEAKKISKKNMTATEKKEYDQKKVEEKKQKEAIQQLYGYALVDGILVQLDNSMVQPPGLYLGHGKHPLRGHIKGRLRPSDITLNVSLKYIPKCKQYKPGPPGTEENPGTDCKWKDVVEDNTVTWLAHWKHPVTNEPQYIWLKRTDSVYVCSSDIDKFEKARKLGQNIDEIRKLYTRDLKSTNISTKQLATAVYLLDVLAIRPGVDKDESKEADTLGLTTLKCGNVKFFPDNQIEINFIGKSSIEFKKTFDVNETVYKNMRAICKEKTKDTSRLFPNVDASTLNDYLKTLLGNLTAKVFRTYKASSILQTMLDEEENRIVDKFMPTHEKKLIYNRVNIEVAKALNHKKMTQSSKTILNTKTKLTEAKKALADIKKKGTPKQKENAKKKVDVLEGKLEEAEENISTSTSKVNYLDPRITISWCKENEMPVEKIYNKMQLRKFNWAMETADDWKF